jgi:hypothetical protein
MARQVGEEKITGTREHLCFYKMEGEHFVRRKSSLTGKKFWRSKCFEGSRRSCSRFWKGNAVAAAVYAHFKKQKELWHALKKEAIALLKEGKTEEEVYHALMEISYHFQPCLTRRKKRNKTDNYEKTKTRLPKFDPGYFINKRDDSSQIIKEKVNYIDTS